MLRLEKIQAELMKVVGWKRDYNPLNRLEDSLYESESGLYFQGAHPLCTLNNIRSVMSNDYPDWDKDTMFLKGERVRFDNVIYQAKNNTQGDRPDGIGFKGDFNNDFNSDFNNQFEASNTSWKKVNPISDFVTELTKDGINTAIQEFIKDKQLTKETKDLLERRTFFDGAARLQATIDNTHKLCGFEIVPVRSMGVTTKIERIGLQMKGAIGNIKLYLFHSSQFAPMKTIELTYTNASGGFQWFTPEEPIYLPYIPDTDGDGNDSGGAWFLCYAQDELPFGMEALNVSKDWSTEPCQTCMGGSIESWKQITKYLQVSPFSISMPDGFTENPEMFDIAQISYTNTMNYGLNLEVTVGCDLTDFIISQRHIFATVIQKQVAATVLRTLAMNPDVNVNRNQVNATRDELLYEIDGTPQGRRIGLAYELELAYKALRLDTEGLDRICLQCNNHGVKYRTI